MPHAMLINATDLDQWAARRESQAKLPHLVRRLIRATTTGLSRLEFAADEGVQLGGWDGISVIGKGTDFVPEGVTGWELGVTAAVKGKADGDFDKRSGDSGELIAAESNFVFVTPRRWGGKSDWVSDHKGKGSWRTVRAYDADDLETWLEAAPGVHIWASTLLGKRPSDVIDIANFWAEWASVTRYPLSSELVISGRGEAVGQIQNWLGGLPSVLDLRAETIQEAIAFYAATVPQLPELERDAQEARSIVVETTAAFRQLALSDQPLVLIPIFQDLSIVPQATARGNHVLLPLGLDAAAGPSSGITLNRPRREAVRAALLQMQVPEAEVAELATLGRRGLSALRRRLAVNPAVLNPAWATPAVARDLLPALLAGHWLDNNESDRAVLSRLAGGRDYGEFAATCTLWANQPDPFIRRVGDTWLVVSREDGWRLLSRFLSNDDLRRFEEVCKATLSYRDPQYELPIEQRLAASILGKELPHSGYLRKGLSETLAIMAALSKECPFQDGTDGEQRAQRVVVPVLAGFTDWQGWASVSSVLPVLAEAAPDAILEAFDGTLRGANPIAVDIFRQEESMFGSSPHTGLLWALECLAWSPAFLSRAAHQLAVLARLDPGGSLGNRPMASLEQILLVWFPCTSASYSQRLKVIDYIRRKEPDIAWRLLLGILPGEHSSARLTATPEFRDWFTNPWPRVPTAEISRSIDDVLKRLVADAGQSASRWCDLIGIADDIPDQAFDQLTVQLSTLQQSLSASDQEAVRKALRAILSRHMAFPDADWVMAPERLKRFQALYTAFEPTGVVERHAWLFALGPAVMLPEGEDWREREKAIDALRDQAVVEINEQGGFQQIIDVCDVAEAPNLLGAAVARTGVLNPQDEERLLQMTLGAPDNRRRDLGFGYVYGASDRDAGWLAATRAKDQFTQGSSTAQADFLLCHPFDRTTWDLVSSLNEEVQRLYWQQVNFFGRGPLTDADHNFIVESMLAHGRVAEAVHFAVMYTRREASQLPAQTLVLLLETLLTTQGAIAELGQNTRYDVPHLLALIEASGEVDEEQLGRLEWAYLPLLEHSRYRPRVLHRTLAQDPAFFCEVLALTYRGNNEEPRDLSEDDAARDRLAFELLRTWRQIPGADAAGSIDSEALNSWIARARELLEAGDRLDIGDRQIGGLLARSPSGEDGAWPHEAVRDVVDTVESGQLEDGLRIGILNSRGVTSRLPDDGGDQERALAATYRKHAEASRDEWPRTSRLLASIAERYEQDAKREDLNAERRQDFWK